MNREEFMKELEYLLSDIPDEEKAEAIGYYRDYLEEAGEENEEEAIKGFGSPERIAAIIRSDLSGNLEDGGEFTEKGYDDERFRDPNYQVAKRYDLPEAAEGQREAGRETGSKTPPPRTSRTVKVILWIILIIVASPMLFGIGGGLFGMATGLLGLLLAAVIVVGVLTGALFICGIALFICGIVSMVLHPVSGLLLIGISVLVLGFALAALALCGVFYGKFLPFLFRSVVNGISSLFYGRRSHS